MYEPAEYTCNGELCKHQRIKRNAIYWTDKDNKYHWCKLDFEHLGDTINVGGAAILKADLKKKKNSDDAVSFFFLLFIA